MLNNLLHRSPPDWEQMDGVELHARWVRSGEGLREFHRNHIAPLCDMTYDAFHGRRWRAEKKWDLPREASLLFDVDIPEALTLEGNAIVASDLHVPCTDLEWVANLCAIADRFQIRQLVIAGDVGQADCFSDYDVILQPPPLAQEVRAGTLLFRELLRWFDHILILNGNHDNRPARKTGGQLTNDLWMRIFTHDERVVVSQRDRCTLLSAGVKWTIMHGADYSVVPLAVANVMAHKELSNIILCHQHHGSYAKDRYKNFVIIDNPALVDERKLPYVQQQSSKKPRMSKGFTMVRGGFATMFLEGCVDWEMWLDLLKAA